MPAHFSWINITSISLISLIYLRLSTQLAKILRHHFSPSVNFNVFFPLSYLPSVSYRVLFYILAQGVSFPYCQTIFPLSYQSSIYSYHHHFSSSLNIDLFFPLFICQTSPTMYYFTLRSRVPAPYSPYFQASIPSSYQPCVYSHRLPILGPDAPFVSCSQPCAGEDRRRDTFSLSRRHTDIRRHDNVSELLTESCLHSRLNTFPCLPDAPPHTLA